MRRIGTGTPPFVVAGFVATLLLTLAPGAWAQEPDNAAELARKLSNPVAEMVSIPFQFNWDNGVGPDDGLRYTLNVQPVVPFPSARTGT